MTDPLSMITAQPSMDEASRNLRRVADIKAAYVNLGTIWKDFREKQVRNYEYVSLRMIDPDTRKKLNDDHRPIFEFPIFDKQLMWLAGKLKRDATKMKAVPIKEGAAELSLLHTQVVNDWAMKGCEGYTEMAKAGIDSWIGGFGAVSNYMTTIDDPEGKWFTRSLDPTAVLFDNELRDVIGQSDMRYICFSKMDSAEEIIQMFKRYLDPDMIAKIRLEASLNEGAFRDIAKPHSWSERIGKLRTTMWGNDLERRRDGGLINDFINSKDGLYRFIEWHDRRMVRKMFVFNPLTQDSFEIPPEKHDDREYVGSMLAKYPGSSIEDVTKEQLWICTVVPGLLPNEPIFEKPYEVQGRGFAIKIVPCYNFHPDITRMTSGLDRLVSQVDYINQTRMSLQEIALDIVNPATEYEVNSIPPEQMEAWKSKQRGKMRGYKGPTKPGPAEKPTEAFQIFRSLLEMTTQMEDEIGGINPAAQGRVESGREGVGLFQAKAAKAEIMVSQFLDNMQEFQKVNFNYTDKALQKFLTFERKIRILLDTNDPQWITLNQTTIEGLKKNDLSEGEYEFRPDVESLGETARKEMFAQLFQILQQVQQMPDMFVYILWQMFEFMDIPHAKEAASYLKTKFQMLAQQLDQQAAAQEAQAKMAMIQQALQMRDQMQPQPPAGQGGAQPRKQIAERVKANSYA